ncbi:MAG: cupin domain-containing protein [Bacteroidia bacterium]|nr:cupin domain-containing protein [Bacteroidia bacterium]
MEVKSNEATPQRPQGDRILNSSLVEMDLTKFIEQIKNEPNWKNNTHNTITIFKSELMRVVLIALQKNALLKPHATNATISVQVLEGRIKFITDEKTAILKKSQMIALQPNITHSVEASEESVFLLTLAITQ